MKITILNQIFDSFIIFKVGFLMLCLFHAVFLSLYNQVRSMDRIVSEKSSSAVLKTVSSHFSYSCFSLFIAAIVIL